MTGFAGIFLILGGVSALSGTENVSLSGEGAMLLAAIFYALSSCCIKVFSRKENPVTLSGYQFMLGDAILVVTGIIIVNTEKK